MSKAVKKLRKYLNENEFSMSAFAAYAQLSPSAISRILAGDRFPTYDTMSKIALATGKAIDLQDWGAQ